MNNSSAQVTERVSVGLEEIATALLSADKFVVASHLNPDGDALGSSTAAAELLKSLGKDVLVFIPGASVPPEYRFIASELIDEVPTDISDRVVLCVDCGNAERVKSPELLEHAQRVINIDHHGDNTHFGELNHVRADAACAAELVWELAEHLGITDPSDLVATAVYVGLVTDTGRFQYSNTTPHAFELAAELQRRGVDVHDVYVRLFESVSFARTKLLGRALEKAVCTPNQRIVATHLSQQDFMDAGANEDDAEGVVDALRSVNGAYVAVFLRDLNSGSEYKRKGSLRTTRSDIDVSVIARSWVGGGHRQAAGFNTNDTLDEVLERVSSMVEAQLG